MKKGEKMSQRATQTQSEKTYMEGTLNTSKLKPNLFGYINTASK